MDYNAILDGNADFPAIGATAADLEEFFRLYGLRCGRAIEIIGLHPDMEDIDQERERQDAVSELFPAMKVITAILLTQDMKVVMPLFVQYFLNDPDCLQFLEIMKANNPDMAVIQDRLSRAWNL